MESGKEEKNEKGEWRNQGCVLWRGSRRGMEREKFWIGVWMSEKERRRKRINGRSESRSGGTHCKLQIIRVSFKKST